VAWSNGSSFYTDIYQKANQAYELGQYDSAIEYYSQVVNANFESRNLYYNLANSYFKNSELAPAIYYYEKANKIAPNDPDVRFNLELANSQIVDKVEKKPDPILSKIYDGISTLLSPNQWAWLSIISLFLALLFITTFLLSESQILKRLTFFGTFGWMFLFLVSFVLASLLKNDLLNQNEAIVFTSTVNVKSEPKLSSADLFVIHEGTKVSVLQLEENWSRISLPDGNEGWVPSEDIKAF
jgi:tetratricopeptide (TPR) repeat protein